ncbi:hypothetical protein L6164_002502 [Bauhinia variegata]|uniref:Uncharacterized protein n=1 Tax=Bauhinia variegata TaxID=167791 RepID=A0ACB9PYI6_BAUVA|nr:hypothetical protein L6164_002502 [Bauhinia variegata]
MSGFLAANPLAISVAEARRLAFLVLKSRNELKPNFHAPLCTKLSNASNFDPTDDNNGGSQFPKEASSSLGSRANRSSPMLGSKDNRLYGELEFKEKEEKNFKLENNRFDSNAMNLQIDSSMQKGIVGDDGTDSSGPEDFTELNSGLDEDEKNRKRDDNLGEEELVRIESDKDGVGLKRDDQIESFNGKLGFRRGKQVIGRSNLLAKQVISISSALSLGFVSQLWVDTTSWVVLFVEVRPNLLSGDSERFLLEDIRQVGDVVLVPDESVIENELKMVGLETLVGYRVVTPSRRDIGKVRGYTFSIDSGVIEALELDSFGISIIPSSLVSTYSLLVEDVLEVLSDAVVVHEAAASRIQRLSKGFLGDQNVGTSMDDVEEYDSSGYVSRTRRGYRRRKKPNPRDWDDEDWELPMDYL